MSARFPKYVLPFLIVVTAASTACTDDDEATPTGPSASVVATIVTAEPATLTPEVIVRPSCTPGSPFALRLVITVGSGRDIIVRRLRISLIDRNGTEATPIAISPLSTSILSTIPSSVPVATPGALTTPSSAPIAIPSGASRAFPLFLEFGCGVPPVGTLVVSVDSTNGNGQPETAELRLEVR